jgi:8-amino-7-oxononanoate synthase
VSHPWLSTLEDETSGRSARGLHRELAPRSAGDELVDLAGNDYLGLSRHPEVLAAGAAALKAYGLGATGSRLVRGSTNLHAELETGLAALLRCEAALVYSSGYLANLGAVTAMVRPGALVVSDAHNHASLVDGCRLARRRSDPGRTLVVRHADARAVEAALAAEAAIAAAGPARPPAVVVTESVFSVDGDVVPLASLHAVARRHGALLLVDDAHGFGVLGPSGAGGVAGADLSGEPDVVVTATLSKAVGAAGGVVAGPRQLVDQLVDAGRTFIFDTALPPVVAGGALAALALVRGPAGGALRAELTDRAGVAYDRLTAAGFAVSRPAGAILSVTAPDPRAALRWAAGCRRRGVAVGCFRPPSTPDGTARLRLTVNAGVPRADFDRAVGIVIDEAGVARHPSPGAAR